MSAQNATVDTPPKARPVWTHDRALEAVLASAPRVVVPEAPKRKRGRPRGAGGVSAGGAR